jgi:hypothetical protein
VAATIKGRIERHDDRIEAFFDGIDPERTLNPDRLTGTKPSYHATLPILEWRDRSRSF